jgi:hypothetical protein
MNTPVAKIKTQMASKKVGVYDKASADFRRHLAYEQAIRQLEQRKAFSAALAHR